MSKEMIMAYLLRAVVMLVAIPVHEAAHAWASWKLGDDTARRAGRMSLNPMAHFDPMGAVCMIFVGVGWAKPVGINPYRFRRPKQGMALSAAAGPASNLVLAFFSLIAYKLIYYLAPATALWEVLFSLSYYMVALNINLAVFNLLPVPPWDGSRIAWAFLPQRTY
ncbi:MAG: site-2 protease family protein, partial [Oscillospiraceae bacterium]|nr:site-2 protease family protein [Oscillospiraceae bacterium]